MAYDFSNLKNEIQKTKEWLKQEYLSLHTGRATPAVLDKVMVEQYGSKQPLQHVASIGVEDARTLAIQPWDKSMIKEIDRAIQASDLGLSTAVSDTGIRVSFPDLTADRRQQLVKVVKDKLEDARITVRQEREKVWDDIQEKVKSSELTEDDKYTLKEELQKVVDEANKELEEMAERKEQDVQS